MKVAVLLLVLLPFLEAYREIRKPHEICYDIFEDDPDVHRNVSQLISSKGYPVENFEVQTPDGFILGVQHIPRGKFSGTGSKGAVLLQHGLLSTSADWVMNFEKESLGFILADAGYDVWLSNTRGNSYSYKHKRLSPDTEAYWDFSFDDMAKYDLPTVIDFVLAKTGQQQLTYIGHSQGTTSAFAMLSENPAYNKKMKRFIALAPVATVGHIESLIRFIAPFSNDLDVVAKLIGWKDFTPSNTILKYLMEKLCESPIKMLCEEVMFLGMGFDKPGLNASRLGVYVAHSPSGTSTKSVVHYGQLVNSKNFQKFDYGHEGNMKRYNQPTPPEYVLENITAPVYLIWSRNDYLADPIDVGILMQRLKSMVADKCVTDPFFNHVDYVWGLGAAQYVYPNILSILSEH